VTKSGYVWVFDRESGESLFPWREMPAPPSTMAGESAWPTQPVPLKPAPFARQQLTEADLTNRTPAAHAAALAKLREFPPHHPLAPPSLGGTIIYPGFDGGAEWGGPAVDPNGVLYVNANEMAWLHQMVDARASGKHPGQAVYAQLCIGCHGPDLRGNAAANVPSLVDLSSRQKRDAVETLLRTGRGMMPSFAFISPPDKNALLDYLLATETATHDVGVVERATDKPTQKIPFATTGYKRFLDPDGYPAVRPPWGTLTAIDLNTGDHLWQRPLGELPELTAAGLPPTGTENYGGPLVTAGGVLFIAATKDEKFRAFDTSTGAQLWETTLPAGGYAVPATYSVGGRQYVVIACGGGKMGTKSGDTYVAFALPETSGAAAPSR
jgi:quinoprotein glucose dehydrogenase